MIKERRLMTRALRVALLKGRMRLKVCGECYKAFFPDRRGQTVICPQCLTVMNERRSSARTRSEERLELGVDGAFIKAMVLDSSERGMGVAYEDEPMEKGAAVRVVREGWEVKGVVVWSKRINGALSASGLRII